MTIFSLISIKTYSQIEIFDKINVYVRQSLFPAHIDEIICTSDYLRLHSQFQISIDGPILSVDKICKVFLDERKDSILDDTDFIQYSVIVIDYIIDNKVDKSINIMKGNKYFRNEDKNKIFYFRKDMIDFLKESFPYIFGQLSEKDKELH